MDENMKKLLNALSEAVNLSLINSNAFIEAMGALWRQSAPDAPEPADVTPPEHSHPSDVATHLILTPDDEHFLRALKIATPV